MLSIVASYPAYDVVDMNLPIIEVSAQDAEVQEFVRPQPTRSHGMLWSAVKVGAVRLYARKHGDDEVAAVERAKGLGHELFYTFNLGTMLHNGPIVKVTKVLLKEGQLIRLDGTLLKVRYERDIYIKLDVVEDAVDYSDLDRVPYGC